MRARPVFSKQSTAMAHFAPLVFMLWLGLAGCSALHRQKRVIGGQECGPNERHFHVRVLSRHGTNQSRCGGSLISDRWILTAAHCRIPGWRMYAILGGHQGRSKEVQITEPPVIYMDRDENNNDREHDIMLLRLPGPTDVQPVPLPDCRRSILDRLLDGVRRRQRKQPPVGVTVQVAGHGPTRMGPGNERERGESKTLQCAPLQVVNCRRLRYIEARTVPTRMHQHWFCGQTPGIDVCKGDSGGGVLYNGKIYGVTSFTGDPDLACTEAAGFMNVCSYIGWIQQQLTSAGGPSKQPSWASSRNG